VFGRIELICVSWSKRMWPLHPAGSPSGWVRQLIKLLPVIQNRPGPAVVAMQRYAWRASAGISVQRRRRICSREAELAARLPVATS
jgi:hypothetical protein